jgi:hypothetical protein
MSKLAILSAILFTSIIAAAYPVEPWPLQNGPGGAPPPPTPAELAAAQAAQQAQMAAYQDYLQQQQQAAQQAMSTGNNELANSFGNMMPGGANGMGTQSVTTPNGNGLDVTGPSGTTTNGSPNYFVNGCSNQKGKFGFRYIKDDEKLTCSNPDSCSQKPPGCDAKIEINEGLSNFMEKHLSACIQQAIKAATGGKLQPVETGKIYNAGIMGDHRHQNGGSSLHNRGLAIDVKGIEVNGRTYVYDKDTDPESKKFFAELRICWGAAVEKERPGCLASRRNGVAQGTIGEENADHHHHLHLSFPYCAAEARRLGLNIAFLQLIMPLAQAAEKPAAPYEKVPEPGTTTSKSMKVKNGSLTVSVRDGHGEPVGADHTITLSVECSKKSQVKPDKIEFSACDYKNTKYDEKNDLVIVRYMSSDLVDGRVSCHLPKVRQFKSPCNIPTK